MEKINSFLQLTGMVLKKNSVLNILLVLFWNLLIVGNNIWLIYDFMVSAADQTAGYKLLVTSYYFFMGLFPVLGSLTLGNLLDAFPDLHFTSVKRFPLTSSFFLLLTGNAGIVLSYIVEFCRGKYLSDIFSYQVLYLGIVTTHIKTVLIAGSALNTFQAKCLEMPRPNMLYYQNILASFKIFKKKMAPMLLGTFLNLTALLILASYDAYVCIACASGGMVPYIMLDISIVVSSIALMLYLSQLAEDTFEAFTSLLENLRLFINILHAIFSLTNSEDF